MGIRFYPDKCHLEWLLKAHPWATGFFPKWWRDPRYYQATFIVTKYEAKLLRDRLIGKILTEGDWSENDEACSK